MLVPSHLDLRRVVFDVLQIPLVRAGPRLVSLDLLEAVDPEQILSVTSTWIRWYLGTRNLVTLISLSVVLCSLMVTLLAVSLMVISFC